MQTAKARHTVSQPAAVLLIGITGSGKTRLAQALAECGLIRLSVDEEEHRSRSRRASNAGVPPGR
ncbi:zeta toxin family protein [Streptomyces sp. NPDC002523]